MSAYNHTKKASPKLHHENFADQLEDAILIEKNVVCKCHLEYGKHSILTITADSYSDYVMAKSVAIKRFNFEPGNISYRNSGAN